MNAIAQRFSRTGVINDWFEDEAAQAREVAAARRIRLAKAAAGVALALALVAGFVAMAAFAVDHAAATQEHLSVPVPPR